MPGKYTTPPHAAMAFCPLGHPNPATYQFCGQCGARTGIATPGEPPPQPATGASRMSAGKWALVAVVLATTTALVATITYFLARDSHTVPTTQATQTWPTPGRSPQTRPEPPDPPPTQSPPAPRPPTPPAKPSGDLGLSIPMSSPSCNPEQTIVVLGNATTPGRYAEDIQRLLNAHPGASYLRTDQSCPSLRQATETGNPIYAVYRIAGRTEAQACAAVRAAGAGAYARWLSTSPLKGPEHSITC